MEDTSSENIITEIVEVLWKELTSNPLHYYWERDEGVRIYSPLYDYISEIYMYDVPVKYRDTRIVSKIYSSLLPNTRRRITSALLDRLKRWKGISNLDMVALEQF